MKKVKKWEWWENLSYTPKTKVGELVNTFSFQESIT